MIQLYHVNKIYSGGVHALQDVNLRVSKGELVFLTGLSGAGKTTLIKVLMGLEQATSGQAIIAGINISRMPAKKLADLRSKIGVVFQDFRLLMDRTVEENIALALDIRGVERAEIERRVTFILKKIGLIHRKRTKAIYLSGGEQQRVAIARATIYDPVILLADEPTGNLDPGLSLEIVNLFKEINARGTTIVVATHNPLLYADHPGRVFWLENGRIKLEG
ncbi:MAG: cell division ATP-binding protein FtsE [Proteobacteria bacterium]|jgi:cell division transport system ATP-binding protein|nr:cell division ATP-binding protein FtsE [Pseudomonadota bacterium]